MSIVNGNSSRRFVLPRGAMAVYGLLTIILFFASSSAPTPLYHLYQQSLGLSPLLVTIIFAVYALALLAGLLTVGSLSDYIGRRPVIFAGLLLNAVAMLLFSHAESGGTLILARAIQGLAAGAAVTALGAAIVDGSREKGALLNSVTPFLGLLAGSFGAALLVTFAPDPLHLVYDLLLALSLIMAAALVVIPETSAGKPGALASLIPQIKVPPQSRPLLVRLTPANVAAWALGGFNLSLLPTVVVVTINATSPLVGGAVVATLMLAAALGVLALRNARPSLMLVVGTIGLAAGVGLSLAGVATAAVPVLFVGSAIAGAGFGVNFSGTLRMLLPTAAADERAGLLAAFYVESYLAFGIPAVVAGLSVPTFGLAAVTYGYGAVIIALALLSLWAQQRAGRAGKAAPALG